MYVYHIIWYYPSFSIVSSLSTHFKLGRKKKKRGTRRKKENRNAKTSIAETYPASPETKKKRTTRRKIIENIELKSTFFWVL